MPVSKTNSLKRLNNRYMIKIHKITNKEKSSISSCKTSGALFTPNARANATLKSLRTSQIL